MDIIIHDHIHSVPNGTSMNEIELDGIHYQRIQPLSTYNWSLTHFGKLDYNATVYCLISAIFGIALWMVIDLTFQIHVTFKRYKGAYCKSSAATHMASFLNVLQFQNCNALMTSFVSIT
jgi:hypothetical protein